MWLVEPVARLAEQGSFRLLAAGSGAGRLFASIGTAGFTRYRRTRGSSSVWQSNGLQDHSCGFKFCFPCASHNKGWDAAPARFLA